MINKKVVPDEKNKNFEKSISLNLSLRTHSDIFYLSPQTTTTLVIVLKAIDKNSHDHCCVVVLLFQDISLLMLCLLLYSLLCAKRVRK